MKKLLLMALVFCGSLFLAGCGDSVDENKTPEQIKSEITSMDMNDIQKMIEKYQEAIAEKAAEIKAETDKLAKIPLTEQLGDEAKKLRGNVSELTKSLDKLKANLEVYTDGLKQKK